MTIFNDLRAQSFVKPYGDKGLLAIEFNGKEGIQAEEVVTELKDDGKTELKEFLEFMVNNVQSMPIIKIVKKTIEENKDEDKDVINVLKETYIPKLDAKISELENSEINNKIDKYKALRVELKQAIADFDTDKASKIKKEIDLLEKAGVLKEAVAQGQQLLMEENIVILANGQKIEAMWIEKEDNQIIIFPNNGQKINFKGKDYITGEISLKKNKERVGNTVFREYIIINFNGDIIDYNFKAFGGNDA